MRTTAPTANSTGKQKRDGCIEQVWKRRNKHKNKNALKKEESREGGTQERRNNLRARRVRQKITRRGRKRFPKRTPTHQRKHTHTPAKKKKKTRK
jgi:hypothetical protein